MVKNERTLGQITTEKRPVGALLPVVGKDLDQPAGGGQVDEPRSSRALVDVRTAISKPIANCQSYSFITPGTIYDRISRPHDSPIVPQ
jgi:hypothetical protein